MSNQKGGSRMDALIKLVLIFFISLLSFSVGTYVGKQVSDSDHRRAQIEGDFQDVALQEPSNKSDKNAPATDSELLSDEEIASLTEEFIKKEALPSAEAVPAESQEPKREVASDVTSGYKAYKPADKSPAHPKAAPDLGKPTPTPPKETSAAPTANKTPASVNSPEPTKKDVAKAAERVAQGQAPSVDIPEPRKPQSVLPSIAATAVGKFTVQIAAYLEESEAKSHAADLKGKGWNAFYIPATIQGKTWYRVSVGLFTSAKSAAEFKKELQKEAKVETALVQKIVN